MSKHFKGVILAIFAMLGFSITYAFYKACTPYLPNTHVIFFQSLFSWLLILPFALKNGIRDLNSPKVGKILLRTIFGILSLYCISRALQTVPLSEVITLNNTAPLFVPLILIIWHKTKITRKLALGLIIGFIGVWMILRPDFSDIHLDLVFAFVSGLFTALLIIATRKIADEPLHRILFYYFLLFWLALSPFVFVEGVSVAGFIWLYILLAAIAMIASQFCFTYSLRYAPAHLVAPFVYTSVIFAALLDWWIWKEVPGWLSALGMLVVCIGGIMTLTYSKKKP
jgi:drug/metabolite transporter (DMT)-like permease